MSVVAATFMFIPFCFTVFGAKFKQNVFGHLKINKTKSLNLTIKFGLS